MQISKGFIKHSTMSICSVNFALVVGLALFYIASSVPVQLYNDPAFLDAEIRRIRSGKAGNPVPIMYLTPEAAEEAEQAVESGDGGYDDEDYTSSEELDVTCAPGKGWHVRGQRCVPIECPGGRDHRDFNSGRCLNLVQANPTGRYRPYSNWNRLDHVYSTHPTQRFLSRGMVSLLRRG